MVSSPLKVIFGLSGMGVAPAGVAFENTGHHHLLINRPPLGEAADGEEEFENALIADENNLHFGKGQTETIIELAPGQHTLQLVLGDADHIPHDPPVMSRSFRSLSIDWGAMIGRQGARSAASITGAAGG